MNPKFVRAFRLPSLLLAAALQVLPMVRAALPTAGTAVNMVAIIFRWTIGAAAALGGVQAVSGASTVITNPLNVKATNGQPFSLRLTTAPNQAHYWTASGLPPGLSVVGTNGQTFWRIMGTPTVAGVYNANLTAKDQMNSGPSLTVSSILTIDVTSVGIRPAIANPPASQTVAQGQTATFTVSANGTAPLIYQWRFQDAALPGKTNASLVLAAVTPVNEGNYNVVVANSYGSVTSSVASLKVIVPPAILTQPVAQIIVQGDKATFGVSATGTAPLTYFWRKDAVVIGAVPNPTWTITNAQPTDSGSYSVVVSNFAGTATSASALLTVNPAPQPPFISSSPTNRAVLPGSSTTFAVVAGGTTPLAYQWYFNDSPVAGQNASAYTVSGIQLTDLGAYSVVVTNSFGSVTSTVATLSFIAPPQITISPQDQTNVVGGTSTFTVTVSSAGAAPSYQWQKDGTVLANNARVSGAQTRALSISNLQSNDAGGYFVVVTNVAGATTSQIATLTVTAPPTALMVVQVGGAGTVSPDYNGQLLQIGRSYNMTALPAAGSVFAGWTGGMTAATPALTFIMQSNLFLQANFVAASTGPVKGTYSGLFYESSGARQQSSGAFTATTTARGNFSAAAVVAGRKYTWSGRFNVAGRTTNVVKRTAPLSPLRIELYVDPIDADHILGTVTDGSWLASLQADRRVFNATTFPCPNRGRYTLAISGKPGSTDVPGGDGFCTATVDAAGLMTVAGKLADGVKFTRSAPVSKSGEWPWYASLYLRTGMILSWQTFTNRTDDDVNGPVIWIRGQQPTATYYPLGFAFATTAAGSIYRAPTNGTSAWSIAPGQYELTGGNLAQDLGGTVVARASNQIVGIDASKLTLIVTPKSGVFSGTFVNPASGKAVPFSGVWMQKRNCGSGFFLGANQSGRAFFAP